jgi:RimJ/RimL family protein N-acetyltransferase
MSLERNAMGQPIGALVPGWKAPASPTGSPMQGRFARLERIAPERHAKQLHSANARDVEGRNWTYLPYGPFDDFDRFRAWLDESCCGEDPCFYAVIDLAQGEAVGLASYLRIDPDAGSIEVGHIHYSPLLQRSPAATEAMFLMMQWAFDAGYRRYEWKCNALNEASRSAALRLGFSYEGTFRQASIMKGRNRDTAWYSIIDREWPALEQAFLTWLRPENFDEGGRQRQRLSALTLATARAAP